MCGRSSSSVTDSGEITPGEQEERIMSSPGMRRPQVWETVDATGPVSRTNRIGADWPAASWGTTEQADVRNADPWPPGALTAANIPVTEPSTEREASAPPTRRTRASVVATLSLIAGSFGVAAALTGLLAPLGFAAGVVARAVRRLRASRGPTPHRQRPRAGQPRSVVRLRRDPAERACHEPLRHRGCPTAPTRSPWCTRGSTTTFIGCAAGRSRSSPFAGTSANARRGTSPRRAAYGSTWLPAMPQDTYRGVRPPRYLGLPQYVTAADVTGIRPPNDGVIEEHTVRRPEMLIYPEGMLADQLPAPPGNARRGTALAAGPARTPYPSRSAHGARRRHEPHQSRSWRGCPAGRGLPPWPHRGLGRRRWPRPGGNPAEPVDAGTILIDARSDQLGNRRA